MGSLKPLLDPATAESIVAKKGTATTNGAVDGSTVVDNGLTEANDYWNDMTILIVSGASDGQSRDITGFTGGTITVSPVFANRILSGVRYFILPFKPSAAEVSDIKGTGFVKDTDSLVDLAHAGEYDTQLDANMSTRAPSNEYDTEMARITADVATEAKQDTIDGIVDDIKAKTDNLPGANTDEQGSFLWDTSAYTTVEQDISALFTTPLTGTTRRRYSLFLDMTGPATDILTWTECTIKVKVEIDGTNPRTVDKKVIAPADVSPTEEPGVPIDIPAVAKDVQVTMQFNIELGSDRTIYYCIVKEALE